MDNPKEKRNSKNRIRNLTVKSAITILGGAMVAAPFMINAADSFASTNGKTANQAITWVRSKVGTGVDADGANGFQCVDLIKAYYNYLGQAQVRGNGCDYVSNATPAGWKRLEGVQPQKGDVLIYTGGYGGYGHVAIYESEYVTYHQNWNSDNCVVRVTNWRYNSSGSIKYWGVIRPDFKVTTYALKNTDGVVCYYKNNKLYTSFTGLVKDSDGTWYYIKKGENESGYTGLVLYNDNWWYIKAGRLNKTYTGLVKYNNNWWYVKKGKLDKTTGLIKHNSNWWFVKKGRLDKTYTGLAKASSGILYYVKNGKYTRAFSGKVKYGGKTYTVKNGVAVQGV